MLQFQLAFFFQIDFFNQTNGVKLNDIFCNKQSNEIIALFQFKIKIKIHFIWKINFYYYYFFWQNLRNGKTARKTDQRKQTDMLNDREIIDNLLRNYRFPGM